MIGNLLFRNSLRFMKKEGKGKIPWDDPIVDENLKNSWIDYFGMLSAVDDIKFRRCLKPENALPECKGDQNLSMPN